MYSRRQRKRRRCRIISLFFTVVVLLLLFYLFLLNTIQVHRESSNTFPSPKINNNENIYLPHGMESVLNILPIDEKKENNNKPKEFFLISSNDDSIRLMFNHEILPNCYMIWAQDAKTSPIGVNYTIAKNLHQRRVSTMMKNKNLFQNSFNLWWSYDDIFQSTIDSKYYIHNQEEKEEEIKDIVLHPCDPINVPFNITLDPLCIELAQVLLNSAFKSTQENNNNMIKSESKKYFGWNTVIQFPNEAQHLIIFNNKDKLMIWVRIDAIAPSLDQRTIKFQTNFCFFFEKKTQMIPNCITTIKFIVKVPQLKFPMEPFAEVSAFIVDRKLSIRRVPPTFIFPISLSIIQIAVERRSRRYIPIEPRFQHGLESNTYDKWLQNDLFQFLIKHSEINIPIYTRKKSKEKILEVWCSFQLYILEAIPLLRSPLRVPYSKQKPGWHRWFNPLYNDLIIPYAPLIALSEQVILDYIIGNDDRSPNKNSFVVGGSEICLNCSKDKGNIRGISVENIKNKNLTIHLRRPSGKIPTIVHLDHGMAFQFGSTGLVNNPLSKSKEKLKFCMFYKPLILRMWSIEKEFTRHYNDNIMNNTNWSICKEEQNDNKRKQENINRENLWVNYIISDIPSVVLRAIGSSAFKSCGKRIVRVLQRVNECLLQYPQEVVLIP